MEKILALWRVFQQGEQVANPAKWKGHQITANALAGVLLALAAAAKAFGVGIDLSGDQAMLIGGGVLAAVNVLLTVATSRTVGLPARSASGDGKQAPAGQKPERSNQSGGWSNSDSEM